MKTISAALVLSGVYWLALSAQTPIATSVDVAFEVASVRPNNSGAVNSSTSGRGGSFTATNVTAHQLIIYACRLRPFQLASGPRWIGSDRFDIQARPPEIAKPDNPAMTRAPARSLQARRAHRNQARAGLCLVLARGDGRLGRSSSRQHRTAQRRSRALPVHAE